MGALALIAGGAGLGYWVESRGGATCYIMSPVFAYRDRDMDHRQRQLLDRLLAEGATSPETHRKAVATLADEK